MIFHIIVISINGMCMKDIIYETVTIERILFQQALSKNMFCFNCQSEN